MSLSATAPVLELDRVTYTYAGATAPSLRDVSLAVAEGEFVVLAGRSAGGKSTMLRAASGLVPHFHGGTFAGEVRVGGLDTREHGPAEVARIAGSLFQDPEAQVVLTTVRAELAFPLENRGHGAAAVARGVEEAALALGIAHLLDRATNELSGGELQRVALGAALAGRPRLVLLDEPTSQLDPVAGDELIWLLRRLNEEWGTTIVLAEHRLERCLPAADRVVVLADGAIACDAPPPDFLAWAADASPELQTPVARMFHGAGIAPAPTGVKEARRALRARGVDLDPAEPADGDTSAPSRPGRRERRAAALVFDGVWHERRGGATVLRAVDLAIAPGERVALMGRNGAGKSTLLRHAAGLMAPSRGTVTAAGRVALLLQDPNDYLLHERVGDEASAEALAAVGLEHLVDRHPHDLSGGQRQRLALAIVLDSPQPAAVIGLDEPTRGMDRAAKAALAHRLNAFAAGGAAVVVATHDPEFAAEVADRIVLLADGRPIADGPAASVLAGGWYFATETARVTGGRALLPDAGAAVLRGREVAAP
ncbi:MAG TPA: ATP-binding cassette domain-containing protein [Baekduia sp.]|uniref:ABC transporter ATP-binding protein n=1 Tax=Baekduia sp. TaxID=2600305 RepID=UPI002CFD92CB|nr:ATP-binding cassette domain-containing protein [Baekduia sp.]HMJ34074.1 ATP-binding cassette domain-containing protein [Baekduia sp.]